MIPCSGADIRPSVVVLSQGPHFGVINNAWHVFSTSLSSLMHACTSAHCQNITKREAGGSYMTALASQLLLQQCVRKHHPKSYATEMAVEDKTKEVC